MSAYDRAKNKYNLYLAEKFREGYPLDRDWVKKVDSIFLGPFRGKSILIKKSPNQVSYTTKILIKSDSLLFFYSVSSWTDSNHGATTF